MRKLSGEQVLKLHDALLEEFGGIAGVRDQGLLDSARCSCNVSFSVDQMIIRKNIIVKISAFTSQIQGFITRNM